MKKSEKLGSHIWFDLDPGDEIRLRQGPALSWMGPRDVMQASTVKAVGAGLKSRALKMPILQTKLEVSAPTRVLAKYGTKAEAWAIELSDQPLFFRGAFYLGHKGEVTLTARKLSLGDVVFLVEATGSGTLYLAFPKNTQSVVLGGDKFCVPGDNIALIKGEPEFNAMGLMKETKDIFKKGGWIRNIAAEISGAEEIWVYGGTMKGLFTSSDDDDES